MHCSHPHFEVHLRLPGSSSTACGRLCRDVLRAKAEVAEITCGWCKLTDEYLALHMERALRLTAEELTYASYWRVTIA